MNRKPAPQVNLQEISIFQALDAAALQTLQNAAQQYHLQPQDVLFYQGDIPHSLYLVQQGSLRLIETTSQGQVVILNYFGTGDIFGLIALLEHSLYPGQAEAIQESLVIGVEGRVFCELMQNSPSVMQNVIGVLVNNVHTAHHRIRELAVERVERRLARALLRFAEKFGDSAENGEILIGIPLSRQELAEFTGTTIETVSRTLQQWQRQGIVRCKRLEVIICQPASLVQIAEGTAL